MEGAAPLAQSPRTPLSRRPGLADQKLADAVGAIGRWSGAKADEGDSPEVFLRTRDADIRALLVMEPTGIEPVTSCLQSRRSPS